MKFAHYAADYQKEIHRHGCSFGIYVIDGVYRVGDRLIRPGSFVWNSEGNSISHGAAEEEDCRILYFTNRSEGAIGCPADAEEDSAQLQVFNIYESAGWIEKEEPIGNAFFDKQMIVDRETGMVINFSRYPAGFRKPRYQLNCAHGMYIIKGAIVTDHGVFGPGNFIWYPKGCACVMTVTADEDCLFLFVTNRSYRIEFLE